MLHDKLEKQRIWSERRRDPRDSMKLDIGTCRSRTGPRKLRFRILAGYYASHRSEFPPMVVCLGPASRDSDTINEFTVHDGVRENILLTVRNWSS